jgi:hypothetical protein
MHKLARLVLVIANAVTIHHGFQLLDKFTSVSMGQPNVEPQLHRRFPPSTTGSVFQSAIIKAMAGSATMAARRD